MSLPRFDTCCCGCSIRTGTLILGWIGLVSGLLSFFGSVVVLSNIDNKDIVPAGTKTEDAVLDMIMALIIVGAELILLLGVYKERESFLKIATYYGYVAFTIGLVGGIYKIVFIEQNKIETFIIFAIFMALYGYFVMIIRSHWLDVKEGKTHSSGYQA